MTSNVCRILIIDADVENRADLRKMILEGSDRQYEFEEADLGANALKQLRASTAKPFDCILLAYCLPDFEAREMLAALCDGQELPPCPVVVLTSSDRQIGRELLRSGAQDYLGKGWITPESLSRAIDNAMERFTLLIDRREKELALRESESRLALGVEVAGLALAEVDYITGYVHLTVDAAKLFGLPQDTLLVPRETVHDAFHPDDHDELMVRIAESLLPSGRGWFAMDHRVLWPNGEVHWLRVRKQVYFLGEKNDRHPVNAMLAVFDVTAEKNAAEIVRTSGEFVRAVLDSLPDHVVVLDDLGTVLAVNQPSDRHTMESSATLSTAAVGVNYIDLCREAIAKGGPDVHVMVDGLEEVLNRIRDDFKTEYPCLAPGREEWFSMHAQRMKSENAGVILIHVNITDSRIAQMKIEESETRFRRLFEAAHDGILILDASTHKITHVNPFLTKLLDYTAEHFLGKELWEIGFLKDKQASVLAMQQLDDTGSIRYEGLPLEDRHGQKHPVELVANKYEEGMHAVIQCNIRDISERRKLEMQMQVQAAELSDLHRRKDEFLAMLSHELRSPLAPIMNAIQLLGLSDGAENTVQKQARGIIERQVGQLQHLVDDLLEVSRITTGRVQLRKERVAIRRIVAGAVETATPLIDQRKHELSISLPPETLWLHADAARLEQVVVNLLTNAAKYTEEGGHIWLSAREEDKQCVLSVRDTGVGIAPALLPKIFDLFTQAERSLDRSQGGLGIGLALVQRLTELHGGRVEVQSVLGKGTEFQIWIPLMVVESDTEAPSTVIVNPKAIRPLRVLVVDDNVDTVLSFSILLKSSGHEVFTAHDGYNAVQVAIQHQPDVVLLDIGLPGLNGYEVAKRIRQQPGGKEIVLIALTGYGQDTDRLLSAQAGFNHHLVKPARLEQVKEILALVADQKLQTATSDA